MRVKQRMVFVCIAVVIVMGCCLVYVVELESTAMAENKSSKATSKPHFGDPRWRYERSICQGDEIPNFTTATANVICAGTSVACEGANITCRGLNAKCEGTNLVHQVGEDAYRADKLTCRGDNVICTGQQMVCKNSDQPCALLKLQYKTPPILHRDVTPDPSQYNIYFIESSAAVSLPPRLLCTLESYCKINPRAVVWLLTTACHLDDITIRKLTAIKVTYHNLEVATINVALALKSTPLEQLYNSINFWKTKYLAVNLSDMLRLAVVYKSGGFYSDTDIIAWKSVTHFTNIIAVGSPYIVNNAAFHFARGHPFLWVEMEDVARNYRGNKWAHQGPVAITRVLKQFGCFPVKSRKNMPNDNLINKDRSSITDKESSITPSDVLSICDLTFLPVDSFYPITWKEWTVLFSPWQSSTVKLGNDSTSIDKIFPTSYGIHLSNHFSSTATITNHSILSTVFSLVSPITNSPN